MPIKLFRNQTEALVRSLLVGLVAVGTLAGHVAFVPGEIPHRGSLDDLLSDASYLLEEADGVYRVEHLVPVDLRLRHHRIVQIADVRYVPFEDFATDVRRSGPTTNVATRSARKRSGGFTLNAWPR